MSATPSHWAASAANGKGSADPVRRRRENGTLYAITFERRSCLGRTADYTIQGFIYQFNKTLMEILMNTEESIVVVEGIVEDIEINKEENLTEAIQCKYHEGQEKFTMSIVYKPILQMLEHFLDNTERKITYKLFAYFPDEEIGKKVTLTLEEILKILNSRNKDLKRYTDKMKNTEHKLLDDFTKKFVIEFGKSLDDIIIDVQSLLKTNGMPEDDIETLIYPNAIQKIANISIIHDVDLRSINKTKLLQELSQIRKTAITRWTRALKSFKKILDTTKKQLNKNLNKNSRLRYFIISEKTLEYFNDNIVVFISEYIDKYHFKLIHDKTPVFCIDCSQMMYDDIKVRLHKKGIRVIDGYVTPTYFDKTLFFKEPIIKKISNTDFQREFDLRLLKYDDENVQILNDVKCDDLYIISDLSPRLDLQDVNVELLCLRNFQEVKYILGMRDSYD